MRDQFPAPRFLIRATTPFASFLSLRTLPLHIHEILPAFCIYQFTHAILAPRLSTYLFPKVYPKLSAKTKVNWNIRVVSLIQATVINAAALWVIHADTKRKQMDWRQRVWGYTGATGMVQGLATGYFLWDLIICLVHFNLHGWGAAVHAVSALVISSLGFRPFVNFYGLNFILYELSTPFLNIHWFLDKLDMTGSQVQLINGIALLASFAGSRLVWGSYQAWRMYQDVWKALTLVRPEDLPVPPWLAIAYVASTTTLCVLNVWWFGKMIETVRKRFDWSTKESKDMKV